MGPTVTLTFQGDETDLMKAVDHAGDGIEELADRVDTAGKDIRSHAKAFDAMGEKTDVAEKKFTGFKDVLDGGSSALQTWGDESMSTTEKLIAFGQAGADMAGGLTDFLIPAISSLTTLMRGGLASAMTFIAAHPLMIALLALAAVFVLLWTRSETFRNIVIGVFNAVKDFIVNVFKGAFDFVVNLVQGYIDIYRRIGQGIIDVFENVGRAIVNAFKAAFNFIADIWNNSVGRLQFDIPSWVPFIGGNHFGVPRIPKFHTGVDTVPGGPGTEMLAILQAGERVSRGSEGDSYKLTVDGDIRSLLYQVLKAGERTGKLKLRRA